MDVHRTISVSRVYVPNEYTIYLSPEDREQFESYETSLQGELQDYLAEHARREQYALMTPPRVLLETETVRWSSISFASLRASSTGCTFVRKARPKMPSNRASILCSIARRTIWEGGVPRPAMLKQCHEATGGPDRHYQRDCGNRGHRQQRGGQESGPEACDAPETT
jgi:hypothetical protein